MVSSSSTTQVPNPTGNPGHLVEAFKIHCVRIQTQPPNFIPLAHEQKEIIFQGDRSFSATGLSSFGYPGSYRAFLTPMDPKNPLDMGERYDPLNFKKGITSYGKFFSL